MKDRYQGRVPKEPSQSSPVEIKRAFTRYDNAKAQLARRQDQKNHELILRSQRKVDFQKLRLRSLIEYALAKSLTSSKLSNQKHREVWKLYRRGVEAGIMKASDALLAGVAGTDQCCVRGEALSELVERNLPVIKKLAQQNMNLSAGEAEAQAIEGVWKAAQRFDPRKGVKFSTYAYNWIFRETRSRTKADRALPTEWSIPLADGGEMSILDLAAVESNTEQTEFFRDLSEVMAEVEEAAREVFERKTVCNESFHAISEAMGLSDYQVRSIYRSVVKQIRAGLEGYGS